MTIVSQPLVTVFPSGTARLPMESRSLDQLDISDPACVPNISVSDLMASEVEGFGRTAQAICVLDQVLKGFNVENVDLRLLLLDRLDTSLLAYLTLVMPQCQVQSGSFCTAINTVIR